MKLKEVQPVLERNVILYEETEKEGEYDDIYTGNRWEIPEEMQEREIVMIGVSIRHKVLEIELKKQ